SLPPLPMYDGGKGIRRGLFNEPRSICVDNEGYVYVADFRNFRIQKFDQTGAHVTNWGSQGNESGQFNDPCDIAVDTEGNIYVADTFNSRVQKFSPDYIFMQSWIGLYVPRGIAVGGDNRVYVANTGGNSIHIFDTEGNRVTEIGRKGTGPLEFIEPIGITVHSDGNIYVCDKGNKRIQVISPKGTFIREIKISGWEGQVFVEPYIAVSQKNEILVTDPTANALFIFSIDGELKNKLNLQGRFRLPMGIFAARDGKVFVVDSHNHKIQRLKELE
ncbi:NHL repeat-containing protein, partial [Spirochaetota bacterium]